MIADSDKAHAVDSAAILSAVAAGVAAALVPLKEAVLARKRRNAG